MRQGSPEMKRADRPEMKVRGSSTVLWGCGSGAQPNFHTPTRPTVKPEARLCRCAARSIAVEWQLDHLAPYAAGDADDAARLGVGGAHVGQRDRPETRRDDGAGQVARIFAIHFKLRRSAR